MNTKFYERIRDSLKDYVKAEDLDDVVGWIYYETSRQIMRHRLKRNGFWVLVGIVLGFIALKWVS